MDYSCQDIAQMIDHSLLRPELTDEDIIKGCEIAKKYQVKGFEPMNSENYKKPMNSYPRGEKATWNRQAEKICNGECPEIMNEIPELLCWLEDYNWPGAHQIGNYLKKLGEVVVPHVKSILKGSEDSSWKYWLIVVLGLHWPPPLVKYLQDELREIALSDDPDEAHIVALEALVKNNLIDRQKALSLVMEKKERYPNLIEDLLEIGLLLKDR
jgi:hypothetical protein